MTGTSTPYQSTVDTGRHSFRRTLRAEWTKFHTVRGWLVGTTVAVLVMVLLGILTGLGSHSSYNTGPNTPEVIGHPYVPIGPDGEAVSDTFVFVHQPLAGDGSITARVTSLTGFRGVPGDPGAPTTVPSRIQPWAKAGLIIKENTTQGSAYAAIMVTGAHGVRMQDNFTGDAAGPSGVVSATSPRWLRLTRTGNTITGYVSPDDTTWTTVATVHLAGLSPTAQAGLFATSPVQETVTQHLGGGGKVTGGPSLATATFDNLDQQGHWPTASWQTTWVGAGPTGAPPTGTDPTGTDPTGTAPTGTDPAAAGGFSQSGGTYTVSGAGDIAPNVAGAGTTIEQTLAGAFGTLTIMAVLAVLFISTEYRRGLIRTSLTATPRRGQILAAKAIVIGAVTFVSGLLATAVTIPLTEHILRRNGNFIYPVSTLTELRIITGLAALLAVAAILALAVGTITRRSAGAVAAVIVLIVLPYILASAGVLPAAPSQWLLRLTPAAAFAVQGSMHAYPQVGTSYTPAFGFYPLGPWTGFAVLCGYTAVALTIAAHLLRRRDA